MNFICPDLEEIKLHYPDVRNIEYKFKGGFKCVYKAEFTNDIHEALKTVFISDKPENVSAEKQDEIESSVKRVIREVNILKKSDNPYIVKLGQIETSKVNFGNGQFIVYSEEYIDGEDLDKLIHQQYKPPETELRQLAYCLFIAIDELWNEYKIIHRDIKPANIIKTGLSDRPFVLLDLGIAYVIHETAITRDQNIIPGTLHYLAPEMLKPNFRESIDYRSDLYTSALTIYEYATRVHPFRKRDNHAVNTLTRILNEKPASLKSLRDDLSDEFCGMIDQLLKKIPAIRPSNLKKLISFMES